MSVKLRKILKSGGLIILVVGAAIGGSAVASTRKSSVKVCVNNSTGSMRQETRTKPCSKKLERRLKLARAGTTWPRGYIVEQSVCDGPDTGTTADELCKLGMTGPAGGLIFFIDYLDQYPKFNYLEAAPEDVEEAPGDYLSTWCSDTIANLGPAAWSKNAVGEGAANTLTADSTCTTGAIRLASDYSTTFNGATYEDWFLPSLGELMLMYDALRKTGVGDLDFVRASPFYWSSTELDGGNAWRQDFYFGFQEPSSKAVELRIRPARSF